MLKKTDPRVRVQMVRILISVVFAFDGCSLSHQPQSPGPAPPGDSTQEASPSGKATSPSTEGSGVPADSRAGDGDGHLPALQSSGPGRSPSHRGLSHVRTSLPG